MFASVTIVVFVHCKLVLVVTPSIDYVICFCSPPLLSCASCVPLALKLAWSHIRFLTSTLGFADFDFELHTRLLI